MPHYARFFRRSLAYDANDGAGKGGSGSGKDGGYSREDLEAQAEKAIEEGRAMQKIAALLEDNYELREERRQLQSRLPGDDQVVLDADQAEQLQELGALGDDGTVQADALDDRLSQGESAQQELQALRAKDTRRRAYDALGLDEDVAEDVLPGDLDLSVEENGEDDAPAVTVATDDGETDFGEWLEATYAEKTRSMLAASESGGDDDSGGSGSLPRQTPGGEDSPSEGGESIIDTFISERNKARTGQSGEEE